ncbi:MAG: HlyD family efflux transporter periplasmic adaptor subunit [Burkholderiaceae bacterium]
MPMTLSTSRRPNALDSDDEGQAALRALLDLHAAVLSHADLRGAAAALVSQTAAHFGYDRVSLGFARGDRVELLALSDGVAAAIGTPLVERLSAAMAEALDQGASLLVPESRAQAHPRITLAQRRLLDTEGGSVASVPIVAAGVSVGALCAQRRGSTVIRPNELEVLEHLACLAGPALHLMFLNERPLRETARQRLRQWWEGLKRPEQSALRYSFIGVALLLVGLTWMPADFYVGGHARLEGAVQRVLVAPADGFLKSVHARPGESVRAGQTLIEFAEQDLQLERIRWQSQRAQFENAYGAANARADRAQLVINQSRIEEAEAQLELVEMKLARGRIEAPFDGLVIQGDLSQSLGAPLQQGSELMTIAPRDQFRVIVEVDERDIAALRIGQTGSVALSALPWNSLAVRVKRITPIASALEGRNVFEVEAELLEHSAELRPGLQGSARILAGRQTMLLNWSRRLVEATRMTWWEFFG